MPRIRNLRWIGLILLVGVLIYAAASIASEPFESDTPQQLYQAIQANEGQWRLINGLAALGLIILWAGFFLLTRVLPDAGKRLSTWGLVLFGLATVLWLVEAALRMTTAVSAARGVVAGGPLPATFPQTVGVGLEPLFVAFLAAAVGGIALLVLSLGRTGLLRSWIAYAAAVLTVGSGIVAAVTYSWVGGVERALFYPLVVVVLPLAIWLLIRGNRLSPPAG